MRKYIRTINILCFQVPGGNLKIFELTQPNAWTKAQDKHALTEAGISGCIPASKIRDIPPWRRFQELFCCNFPNPSEGHPTRVAIWHPTTLSLKVLCSSWFKPFQLCFLFHQSTYLRRFLIQLPPPVNRTRWRKVKENNPVVLPLPLSCLSLLGPYFFS